MSLNAQNGVKSQMRRHYQLDKGCAVTRHYRRREAAMAEVGRFIAS